MKKIVYIEEVRAKYSETFVSSEKEKISKLGYDIDEVVLSELSINLTKLMSYKSIQSLFYGIFISFSSLPNVKRFFSNLHASLLISCNIDNIESMLDGVDEVRAHFLAKRATAAYLVNKIFNVEYTLVAHAADIFDWDGSLNLKIHNAKRIDAISNYNVGYIHAKTKFVSSDKINLIRNSFNEPTCELTGHKSEKNVFNFLMVTRLVEKKGVLEALELFHQFNSKHKNSKLYIAGDGPLFDVINQKVQDLKLINSVLMLGVVSQDQVSDLLESADAFILLCKRANEKFYDMDGIPTVFFESLYAGKPVITNSVSGIPELIIDGFNGVLVDNKKFEDIIVEIEELFHRVQPSSIRENLQLFSSYDIKRFY